MPDTVAALLQYLTIVWLERGTPRAPLSRHRYTVTLVTTPM